jgi:monoamine oxidase
MPADLNGVSILVAGGGLAGLCAARDLTAWGAKVTVIEARDHVGGRVHTARQGFVESQHAEAGGDMIDEAHHEIHQLAKDLRLSLVRILKGGFAYARPRSDGTVRIDTRSVGRSWERMAEALAEAGRPYRLAEKRWESPIARELARRSVAQWLDEARADEELRATATGLRGFFLADPEELSLLELIDQFASNDGDAAPAPGKMYRVKGGNDQLATTLAEQLGDHVQCASELVAVSQRGRSVRATIKNARRTSQLMVDYLVFALPATLLRRIPITPALPARQHEAIARLNAAAIRPEILARAGSASRVWFAPVDRRGVGWQRRTDRPLGNPVASGGRIGERCHRRPRRERRHPGHRPIAAMARVSRRDDDRLASVPMGSRCVGTGRVCGVRFNLRPGASGLAFTAVRTAVLRG